MRSKFIFGDKSTEDFCMRIEKLPPIVAPKRRMQTVSVAGRNGDLHYQEGAFENYIQPYECYFHSSLPTTAQAHAIHAWLLHSGVYRRLQDTYDPGHYRMATFAGPLETDNYFKKYGRCVINFDCAPQAFLVSGDYPCDYDSPGEIYNPTLFPASPQVTVYGTGSGTVTLGDTTVIIHAIADHLELDCDLQNAYKMLDDGTLENCNLSVYAPVFPTLMPGTNRVDFSGDITGVKIVPKWWEL